MVYWDLFRYAGENGKVMKYVIAMNSACFFYLALEWEELRARLAHCMLTISFHSAFGEAPLITYG